MKLTEKNEPGTKSEGGMPNRSFDRRTFMRYAGTAMAATSLLAVAGCADSDSYRGEEG